MYTWFDCKVLYDKMMDNGLTKKQPESYLVDAINITEAESRITEEMRPYIHGEFEVTDIRKAKYAEIFDRDTLEDGRWYKIKLVYTIIDEKKQKEKKTSNVVLVKAFDVKQALANLEEGMKGSVIDYTVASIVESSYIDVFRYVQPSEKPQQI